MTPIETRAMTILRDDPCSPGQLGEALWWSPLTRRLPQSYARPAGRVLRSLERQGLVACAWSKHRRRNIWRATHPPCIPPPPRYCSEVARPR